MIVAVMQPYFFPYIGYFQLMHAVDMFIFYDNVQYMKGGWVNRNQVPVLGNPVWLTLPVASTSYSRPINQRHYLLNEGVKPIKRKLCAAYPGRMQSAEARFIEELLDYPDSNVAAFNVNLLRRIAQALDIRCKFMMASELADLDHLRGQEKVIELCRRVEAKHYVNPIGGLSLYSATDFRSNGLSLSFLRTTSPMTELRSGAQHLSIIDGFMQQGGAGCAACLDQYTLVEGNQ